MESSLVIATYNWSQALELCFKSIMQQSVMPTEIIVADDGSGPDTKLIVEKYQKLIAIPLIHLWHKDEGFKLAQIRNKAAAKFFALLKPIIVIKPNKDISPEVSINNPS